MLIIKEKIWSREETEMKEDIQLCTQENIKLQVFCLRLSFGFTLLISEDFSFLEVK